MQPTQTEVCQHLVAPIKPVRNFLLALFRVGPYGLDSLSWAWSLPRLVYSVCLVCPVYLVGEVYSVFLVN